MVLLKWVQLIAIKIRSQFSLNENIQWKDKIMDVQ